MQSQPVYCIPCRDPLKWLDALYGGKAMDLQNPSLERTIAQSSLPQSIWLRIVVNGFQVTASSLALFLSYYFVKELHFSLLMAGKLISLYGLGALIGGLSGPYLSPRYSARTLSLFTLGLGALALLNFLYLFSLLPLAFNVLLLGFSTYLFKTLNTDQILKQCNNASTEKSKVLRLLYLSSNLGIGLAMLLVSLFYANGFEHLFALAFAFVAVPSLCLCWCEKKSTAAAPSELEDSSLVKRNSPSKFLLGINLAILFLGGLIFSQLGSTYALYLSEKFPDFGIHAMSILTVMNLLLIFFMRMPLLGSFHRINAHLLAGIGGLILGLGFLWVSLSSVFSLAMLGCAIYSIGEILLVSMTQWICRSYEAQFQKKKTSLLTAFQFTLFLSWIIGPTLGTEIYHFYGGDALWWAAAFIGGLCFALGSFAAYYSMRVERVSKKLCAS